MPTPIQQFPDDVMVAINHVTVTCTPVQIDHDEWQTALFSVLPENATCLRDGQFISTAPFTVAFDARGITA